MQRKKAQMAESVDALVSNTSGATRAGSTPALGTEKEFQYHLKLLFSLNTLVGHKQWMKTFSLITHDDILDVSQ